MGKDLIELAHWESKWRLKAKEIYSQDDPAHDYLHIERVVRWVKILSKFENANPMISVPAGYFHDFVNLPKNHPERKRASQLSAAAAIDYLRSEGYPSQYFEGIKHAIESHSFSAKIQPNSVEAQVVQDSDRLDSLGSIGVARCFSVSGMLKRPFYDELDPWAIERTFDDNSNTLDHFFVKLFKLPESFQTRTGQNEALRRVEYMKTFLTELKLEIEIEIDACPL